MGNEEAIKISRVAEIICEESGVTKDIIYFSGDALAGKVIAGQMSYRSPHSGI